MLRRLIATGAFLLASGPGSTQEAASPLVVVDVPFLAQTEELCGGAASAMVLRYWGVSDVQPEDFAPLVDHAKGGISTGDLVKALTSRGVVPRSIRAEGADVAREIESGRPVIALIDGGGGRLHYVVIVGWKNDRVLFHDPSVGPFRMRSQLEFQKLWRVTDGFAVLVTPGPGAPTPPSAAASLNPAPPGGACDVLVDPAVATARGPDAEAAVPALLAAADLCPGEARALGALAGVRFRQERWKDAAEFARGALKKDPADADTWRLLGASLYLADDPQASLDAWNHIGEPRLDRVQIDGLVRTRQDLAAAVVGLHGRDVLTRDSMARAQRRLEHMPTSTHAKVTFRPATGGHADVVATMGEAKLTDPWLFLAVRLPTKAVVRREMSLRINSPTGRGEGIELGWRFADHRPSLWASIDTPRLAGLPGVVSLSGVWDQQTYRPDSAAASFMSVENRRRGAVSWSNWVSSKAQVEVELAIDRFEGRGGFASSRFGAEVRTAKDHVALVGDLASWVAVNDVPGFSEFGGTVAMRSSVRPGRLLVTARFDGRRATRDAPLAAWPGAGTGPGRPLLLRGSPLLEDGELVGAGFGRGLLHATIEAEVRIADRGPGRLDLAVFSDWARPWDTALRQGSGQDLFAVGAGLRLRVFSNTAFRVDVAKRPGHRGVVLSGGVIPRWPR